MHRVGRVVVVVAATWIISSGVAFAQETPVPPADPPPADAPAVPEEDITVRGRVIDNLGRPIRKATVTVEGTFDEVLTDKDGFFEISARLNATLIVSTDRNGVALATVTGPVLDEIVLMIDLATEEITISDRAPIVAPGSTTLDRDELQRLPGTGGDVVRALTAMPGVVNVQIPVGYSGVVIRGASPQDSKVLVDGFEIPILFHPFGFRAIIATEAVKNLTFIPGGFEVAYGRSSSGIVLLETRPGSENRSTQAEVSLVDGGLVAQGPLSKKTRYMFALRRSFIDFILPLVIPDTVDLSLTTVPQYWDGQLRVDHEVNSKWNLTASSIGTTDKFELFTTKDEDSKSKRFFTQTRFIRLTGAAKYHEGPWSAQLALSGMLSDLDAEVGLYQKLKVQTRLITPRVSVARTEEEAFGLKNVVWTGGVEAQIGHSTTELAIPLERREGEPFPPYDPKDTASKFKGTVWFPDYAAWTSIAADFDERFRVTTGLRADYFSRPDELVIAPRSELQIKLTPKTLTARFNGGFYSRPPEFQSEFLQKEVRSERSQQLTMGLEYTPFLGIRVQGSTYYTYRTQLITHNVDGTLGNNGRGESKGFELLAMLTNGTWFGWLGYSYSNSSRIDGPDAKPRLFDYDQPHSLNAALSWKKGHWQIGGRFQLYSGLPGTPIVGAEFDSDRNLHIPIPGEINSDRAPIHHQLDVRIDYTWKWGPAVLLAFLDVQNVYLDRSIVTYFYSYDYTQKSAFESLPLIPSIGLRGTL